MRRFWPALLIATGLLLLVAGFIYDVMFAGIPYQDPTPEMTANYNRQAGIAATIRWWGIGTLVFGVLLSIIRTIIRRFRPPGVS